MHICFPPTHTLFRMSILYLASLSMKVKMTLVIREGGYIELGRINTVPFHLVSTKIARSENRDWIYFIIYRLIWTLGRHLLLRKALPSASSIISSRWHVKEIALSLLILGYEVHCNSWWAKVEKCMLHHTSDDAALWPCGSVCLHMKMTF